MTFLKDTYNYLSNITTTKYLIFFMILSDVIFQLISSKLMINISTGDTSAIIYLLIIKVLITLVNQFVVNPLYVYMNKNITIKEFIKTYTAISNKFIDEYYHFYELYGNNPITIYKIISTIYF